MWKYNVDHEKTVDVLDPYTKETQTLYINETHVELLKRSKGRGRYIIVWSHAGYQWAEAVVKALQLERYVDVVMSKVEDYVDDLKCGKWITKNLYQHGY